MADREQVIKGFECCHVMVHNLGPDKSSCGICPYKDVQTEEQIDLGGIECIAVLHDDALALLKEQEAVEARKKCDGKPQPWSSWWYVCGDCGQEIEYHDRYCRWCGRAVKWE